MPATDDFTYGVWLPALLDIFSRLNIRATFFCIAERLDIPEAEAFFARAVDHGHEIANHTLSHPAIERLDREQLHREISEAHRRIRSRLGVECRGYRAPAYHITSETFLVLGDLGYRYDSSVFNNPLGRLSLQLLKVLRPNYRPTGHSELHHLFHGRGPWRVGTGSSELMEWPIPSSFGLGFYGTLHSVTPAAFFHAQRKLLARHGEDLHYELHPIELACKETVGDMTWLPTVSVRLFPGPRDPAQWLEHRLRTILRNRKVVTLEELSA